MVHCTSRRRTRHRHILRTDHKQKSGPTIVGVVSALDHSVHFRRPTRRSRMTISQQASTAIQPRGGAMDPLILAGGGKRQFLKCSLEVKHLVGNPLCMPTTWVQALTNLNKQRVSIVKWKQKQMDKLKTASASGVWVPEEKTAQTRRTEWQAVCSAQEHRDHLPHWPH